MLKLDDLAKKTVSVVLKRRGIFVRVQGRMTAKDILASPCNEYLDIAFGNDGE